MSAPPVSFWRVAMRVRRRAQLPHSGFTTVELIVVIVIAGILAAFATARFVGKGGFESRGYFDEAVTVVRHAQKTAIAQRRNVIVVITADRIGACYVATCNPGERVAAAQDLNRTGATVAANCLNDASWLCAGRPDGVASIMTTAASITFDALGRPSTAATVTVVGTEAGDTTRQIIVEAETGYVRQG